MEVAEAIDFPDWVSDDHFTHLGYREYTFTEARTSATRSSVENSALGIPKNFDLPDL